MKKLNRLLFFIIFMSVSFCFTNRSFAETKITGANKYIQAIGIQSDGKIIIGGNFTSYGDVARNKLARLNSDGSLDKEFNPNININSIKDILIQQDGKILLLIDDSIDNYIGNIHSKIMRLNSDGSVDTSFNSEIEVQLVLKLLTIQPDGKIIIGGFFNSYNNTTNNCIIRLNPNGSVDTSFNPPMNKCISCSSYPQPDGKIIISWFDENLKNYIIRLNSDDSVDTSFNYTVMEGFGYFPYIQSDGKIILGGGELSGSGKIIRLNSDGSVDTSFNAGVTDKSIDILNIQSDGKIVIGGNFNSYNNTAKIDVARLNVDGSLDTSFSTPMPIGDYNTVDFIKTQLNDKLILVLSEGVLKNSLKNPIANPILRLNSDGSLDANFGSETNNSNTSSNLASTKLRGKLLLAVEDHGRIWYIGLDGKRYEVTFANAMGLFKKLSLGITNSNLSKISETKTTTLGSKLKGKLLLAVEDRGRIWYIDTNGLKHEVTFANLMDLFKKLSLGITNTDLNKITIGQL